MLIYISYIVMIKIYKGTTHFIYFLSKVKQLEAKGKWTRSRTPDRGKKCQELFFFLHEIII